MRRQSKSLGAGFVAVVFCCLMPATAVAEPDEVESLLQRGDELLVGVSVSRAARKYERAHLLAPALAAPLLALGEASERGQRFRRSVRAYEAFLTLPDAGRSQAPSEVVQSRLPHLRWRAEIEAREVLRKTGYALIGAPVYAAAQLLFLRGLDCFSPTNRGCSTSDGLILATRIGIGVGIASMVSGLVLYLLWSKHKRELRKRRVPEPEPLPPAPAWREWLAPAAEGPSPPADTPTFEGGRWQ